MSVFINSLDDFIAPSQACVNPFVQEKLEQSKGSSRITLQSDFSTSEYDTTVKPDLIKFKTESTTRVATVSLNDCLACSGCVTSAEAVLIQEQSYHKLVDILNEKSHFVVVTLSPQSVASIASFMKLPTLVVFLKLAAFLKSLGVRYVFDASAGGDISLLEAREEFVSRYSNGRQTAWTIPPLSMAHSSTRVILPDKTNPYPPPIPYTESSSHQVFASPANRPLPMFGSHCPGWICYAEKTNPQCIPYMSTAKSAQQIIGTILKLILPTSGFSAKAEDICHVSVQPCFDKKLEASRQDFLHEAVDGSGGKGVREVDLVLSTTELWRLVEEHAAPLTAIEASESPSADAMEEESSAPTADSQASTYLEQLTPDTARGCDAIESMFRSFSEDGRSSVVAADSNAGSGGFLEYLFRYAAKRLHDVDVPADQPLQYMQGRNSDIAEVSLPPPLDSSLSQTQDSKTSDPEPLLRFAKVYGFRNIQSLMLKMKRGKVAYDFIEIMACPSGCVNGGGQIKTVAQEHPSQTSQRVNDTLEYYHDSLVVRDPALSPLADFLYNSGSDSETRDLSDGPFGDASRRLFHTFYHSIPKLEVIAPLASKW